jgi:hypothetical protein
VNELGVQVAEGLPEIHVLFLPDWRGNFS